MSTHVGKFASSTLAQGSWLLNSMYKDSDSLEVAATLDKTQNVVGAFSARPQHIPIKNAKGQNVEVLDIFANECVSAAISMDGKLYTWGTSACTLAFASIANFTTNQ